ncbi:MAG: hypothetical protein KDD69_11860, partial [Bdellovibrionales bacterium]|nr:hypothetical protein [Bdellovibrionales bacterium]
MSTPSFAAFYCLFDDDEWLTLSIRSIYSAVDAIYFFVSDIPWNGPQTDNTRTIETIRSFPD